MVTPKILWIASEDAVEMDSDRFPLLRVEHPMDGLEYLRKEDFDVVLVCLPLANEMPAAILLEEIQQVQPETPVVIHAPEARATEAVRLLHLGAFHVLQHGDPASLLYLAANSKWAKEAQAGVRDSQAEAWRRTLVGQSRAMEHVIQTIRLVARRRSTVLITGETGTGKEVVAQAIHRASDRARFPLVCVNCSALPEALLEAELFGHVRGAFTGATNQRIGRFEQAHRGTIFLDEIGDLPLSLQTKLLRVLQEREFQRLGSSETISVDLRVIAATNRDLNEMIRERKFREDLYYRLNVVPISIPPVRERSADIGLLVCHFIEKFCEEEKIPLKMVSRETLERLASHDWPGNVRQLENAVEKAVVLSGEREILVPGDFPLPERRHPLPRPGRADTFIAVPDQGIDFEKTVGSIERKLLEQALQKTRGNKKLAAEMLGLKRTTLSAKLKSFAAVPAAV